MFCLRSWIPVLFFLQNASPVYLVLFLSTTYFLNRPCVYCSLLLAILIFVLFDFRQPWFEPRNGLIDPDPAYADKGPLASLLESAAAIASALNDTAALAGSGAEAKAEEKMAWSTWAVDWVKNIITRREVRIDCMNTVIRL